MPPNHCDPSMWLMNVPLSIGFLLVIPGTAAGTCGKSGRAVRGGWL